jgi:uncharacterized membrane protein YcfT
MRKQKNVPKFGMKKFLIQISDPKKIPYFVYILGAFRDETLVQKNTSYFTLEITFYTSYFSREGRKKARDC